MDSLLRLLLTNAAAAAALASVAWLASRVVRRPSIVHALWLTALLRLVVPPVLSLPILPGAGAETPAVHEGAAVPPAPVSGNGWNVRTEPGAPAATLAPRGPAAPVAEAAGPAMTRQASGVAQGLVVRSETAHDGAGRTLANASAVDGMAHRRPTPVLRGEAVPWLAPDSAGLWTAVLRAADARARIGWVASLSILFGASVVLALGALRHGRFSRLLRSAGAAPDDLAEQARALGLRLGLRSVPPVRLVAAGIPPMLWPTRSGPQLLLPRDLLHQLTNDERAALLVHELAHVRRRDHWVRLVEIGATALFWWYPLAWWTRRALRCAEERCCDEWVLRTLPGSAAAYANALLKCAALVSDEAVPAGASGIGPVRDLESRLKEVFMSRPSTPAAAPLRLALAALTLAGLCVFPTPAAPVRADEGAAASGPAAAPVVAPAPALAAGAAVLGTPAPWPESTAVTPAPAIAPTPSRQSAGVPAAAVAAVPALPPAVAGSAVPAAAPALTAPGTPPAIAQLALAPGEVAPPVAPLTQPAPTAIPPALPPNAPALAPRPEVPAGAAGTVPSGADAGSPLTSRRPAQEPPAFPAGVDVVRLDAVVLDRKGRPVQGLTAGDFEVLENGRPRSIASFEAVQVREPAPAAQALAPAPERESASRVLQPEEGRAVLLFFDDIHVQFENSVLLRQRLPSFLSRELRAGDAVTIVAPQQGLWWTARTAWEHAQLPAVIGRLRGQYVSDPFHDGTSDWLAMQHVERGGDLRTPGANGIDPANGAASSGSLLKDAEGPKMASAAEQEGYGLALLRIQRSLNGLQRAIESLASFRGRKSVVVYSEGFILSPRLPDYARVIDLCRRANVAIYVSDPRGLRTGSVPSAAGSTALGSGSVLPGTRFEAERAGSTHIALATGGAAYSSNDVTEALGRVLEDSRSYYLIGFEPAPGASGERKLQVRVRGKDLRVRARTRYVAGPTPDSLGDAAPVRAARELSDRAEVPIRVATTPADGGGAVELRITFPPAQPARERRVKLLVERRPLAGGAVVHETSELTLPASNGEQNVRHQLRLASGVWQARVVVTDLGTGAIGSALHTFDVQTQTASGTTR